MMYYCGNENSIASMLVLAGVYRSFFIAMAKYPTRKVGLVFFLAYKKGQFITAGKP